MRLVRISFRSVKGSRRGGVKAFTNQRLPNERHPKQIHLGYLPATLSTITGEYREKLERRLRSHWLKYFPDETVEIDWNDAEHKWITKDEVKRAGVDRTAAWQQIQLWLLDAEEKILPQLQERLEHNRTQGEPMEQHVFSRAFRGLPALIAGSMPGIGEEAVADWWEQEEAPRLLYCYCRHVNRTGKHPFSRFGFLHYLVGNIRRGYAKAQFLRSKSVSTDAMYQGTPADYDHQKLYHLAPDAAIPPLTWGHE